MIGDLHLDILIPLGHSSKKLFDVSILHEDELISCVDVTSEEM